MTQTDLLNDNEASRNESFNSLFGRVDTIFHKDPLAERFDVQVYIEYLFKKDRI